MNRRKALEYTASILGVTIVGADAFLSGCARPEKPANLIMEKQIRLLDEIGETILPASERSPGARAAGIGRFMNRMITECYSKEEYRILASGIDEVEQASKDAHRRGFLKLNIQERHEIVGGIRPAGPLAGRPAAAAFLQPHETIDSARVFHIGNRCDSSHALQSGARWLQRLCRVPGRR
jgi:hypothetical protein